MQSIPWPLTADQLRWLPRDCCGCKVPLVESARQLELDNRDWTYHDFRDIPEERSQGWFPFCLDCAVEEIDKAIGKRKVTNSPSIEAP